MTRLSDSTNPRQTAASLRWRFPAKTGALDQDQEWCEIFIDDEWKRIRFHDYHEVYPIPGLYEALFVERLKCNSPQRVVGLLDDVLSDFPQNADDLRVIDIGAGNGMVGQELRNFGVKRVVGVDIIPEARDAALRDRPDVYEDYVVADLTDLDDAQTQALTAIRPNALSVVAALGYGDIPALAFINACNLIEEEGYLVFNIKEDFLHPADDSSGFSKLIHRLQQDKLIQIQAYRRYRHRLNVHGQPLHYIAMVATKAGDIPQSLAEAYA